MNVRFKRKLFSTYAMIWKYLTSLPPLTSPPLPPTQLDHATRITALELGQYGIRVNAVRPTVVETELALQNWTPAGRAAMARAIPLQRLAQPIDVAHVVAFLLCPALASLVSGVSLRVDGGWASSRL